METLYNHSTFLKDANKRFSTSTIKSEGRKKDQAKQKERDAKKKEELEAARKLAEAQKKAAAGDSTALKALQDPSKAKIQGNAKGISQQKKQIKGFAGEVQLPDSAINLKHNQKSKRIVVTAKDENGKPYKLRYKVVDENTIRINPPKELAAAAKRARKEAERKAKELAETDSLTADSLASLAATTPEPDDSSAANALKPLPLRVNVVAKPKLEDQKWYQWTQAGARFLMMLRNVSVSYRNTYALVLPGFMPNVGDMLGQSRHGSTMAPGAGFAFGFVGDSFIDKAQDEGWLLNSDSVATPATSNSMEDLQIKATLEPLPDLKIDLNASRTVNGSKSMQYMYAGNPTTRTGSFNMTTISLRTAFQSRGNASNGYDSKAFRRFQEYLGIMQGRVEGRYIGTRYPEATGMSGTFNPENGTVDPYSGDVMIPAFLAAYTGKRAAATPLDIFPSVARILPNWSLSYKGLSNLPWVRDHLKSVTLTHGYKSIYAVGSYNSYSSWVEYLGGNDMGYVMNTTTGLYSPSSMYDISTVSFNESFSPLIGLNVTMQNNMTVKLEYRKTRVLTLSMTSAQINEASSADLVFGWGYKIDDFKIAQLFSGKSSSQKAAAKNKGRQKADADDADNKAGSRNQRSSSRSSNFAHSLNLRFDFSLRNQDAITRNIQTSLSEATSGNRAVKTSFIADYAMSRYVTFSLYYNRQRNQPLLSSSAYPTITQDFGVNLKLTLTR